MSTISFWPKGYYVFILFALLLGYNWHDATLVSGIQHSTSLHIVLHSPQMQLPVCHTTMLLQYHGLYSPGCAFYSHNLLIP